MDTWLTFHDYRNSIKTDGGTQTVSLAVNGFKAKVKGCLLYTSDAADE